MRDDGTIFFLDFDGVICDSIRECFISSWCALFDHRNSEPPASIGIEYWNRFRSVRPFIRSGEDYLLIHELLLAGKLVRDQADFDRQRDSRGARMLEYKRAMQARRERFIATDKGWWLGLHSLYEGLESILGKAALRPNFHILSTKRASLIAEILSSYSIGWPMERIHYSGDEEKLSFIREITGRENGERAVFVDDQKDHFAGCTDERIRCLLASWGYVKQEWLSEHDVEILSLESFRTLLAAHLQDR